jgi:hypothetical protein
VLARRLFVNLRESCRDGTGRDSPYEDGLNFCVETDGIFLTAACFAVYTQRERDTTLSFLPLVCRECVRKYMCQLPARTCLARSPCGLFSAFVLVSLLTADASVAVASCGDYVHVGNPQAAQGMGISTFAHFKSSALKFSSAPFDPQSSCRGPNCRAHSTLPAAPPRTVQRFDHWACLPTPTWQGGCYKMPMRTEMALFVPEGHPFLHKRPPRSPMQGLT